ncbi:MAG: hypothetical protein KatS3mg129_0832 [Leptospiraceae bacterium]|nr:MAG: hypothetical protein KatS3mg129_0832 [Leptospiraceae bacterium]
MKGIKLFLVLYFSFTIILSAGPKEGVMSEFRAVEEGIRKKFRSEKEQKEILENNLLRALKMSILRRFYYDADKYLKDLNINNISWEAPLTPNIYYVKYKYFIVRYDFANDPRFFLQSPVYEKFLIMDEFTEQEHDNPAPKPEGTTQPQN